MKRLRMVLTFGRNASGSVLLATAVAVILVVRGAVADVGDRSPMRLPFAVHTYITNGPNCTTHRGASAEALDVALERGTPVLAAQSGTATWAGVDPAQPSFGKLLRIRHGDGTEAWYAHLDEFLVRIDDEVINGQPVALSGSTGDEHVSGQRGEHLHFEVRDRLGVPVAIRQLPGITWTSDDYCGGNGALPGVALGAPPTKEQRSLLWFELIVPGIGIHGNRHPQAREREKVVRVKVRDAENRDREFEAVANFESDSGSYVGVADLGTNWISGTYHVNLRMSNTLGTWYRGFLYIAAERTTVLQKLVLESGDVDDNNVRDAYNDYQVLHRCFSVHGPPLDCSSDAMQRGSDLNDDGLVDFKDHDLFVTFVGEYP